MKALLEPMKNIRILEPLVTVRSTVSAVSLAQMEALADALAQNNRQ